MGKEALDACARGLVLLLACSAGSAQAAVVIDGKVDEADWEQARRYDDFKITEPYSLSSPDSGTQTQALLLSTPDGIAVAFKVDQKPGVRRVKPRLERDRKGRADQVNVLIDFDGDGLAGYSFTVGLSGSIKDAQVSNENIINGDWDTDWSWAVTESETGWQAELLIPWTVAPMRGTDTPNRTIGVYFSRLLGDSNERQSFPAISSERGRYLSGLEKVEIPQYRTALFHYWPYLTANHDMIDGKTRYKAGVDVFWKPSPRFQLSGTINPDFGQVEADDLVINFDAVETFFTDKRPFFTENQSIFDLSTPDSGRLIHTRRIGGNADDGSGASDIDAAVKLNGSLGAMSYGLLAASESDDVGRDFYALRLLYPLRPGLSVGWLSSDTEHPYLDRSAQVHAADIGWKPTPELIINAQVLGSFIDQRGKSSNDAGAWLRADWAPSDNWNYELEATHFGSNLNFNDLGYQRRASLNEVEATAQYIFRSAEASSRLRSSSWQVELQARSNDHGDRLPTYWVFTNTNNFRSGNLLFFQASAITSGWDDLISRGNGLWRRSGRYNFETQLATRRYGDWSFSGVISLMPIGLGAKPSNLLVLTANWYPSDAFNASLELSPEWTDDWLIWEGGNTFGRYKRHVDSASLNLSWFPGQRHELRLKSEWIAISAERGQRYLLQGNGGMLASGQSRPDFDINNFGLQLRYRYLIGPQSDIFLAYSRGGMRRQERDGVGTADLFDEALSLRDSDQLLAKIRYRF